MIKLEDIYLVFYRNGTKKRLEAPSDEQLSTLENNPDVEFITNAKLDYPFDYEWNFTIGMWQSQLF